LSGIVKTMHDAYRQKTAEIVIASPEAAYYNIREYYSLCLPVTIESKIEEYLSDAKANPVNTVTAAGSGAKAAAATDIVLTPWGVPVTWSRR
jgi:hypothetical protein